MPFIQLFNTDNDPLYLDMSTGQCFWLPDRRTLFSNINLVTHTADDGQFYYEDVKTHEVSWSLPKEEFTDDAYAWAEAILANDRLYSEQAVGTVFPGDECLELMDALDEHLDAVDGVALGDGEDVEPEVDAFRHSTRRSIQRSSIGFGTTAAADYAVWAAENIAQPQEYEQAAAAVASAPAPAPPPPPPPAPVPAQPSAAPANTTSLTTIGAAVEEIENLPFEITSNSQPCGDEQLAGHAVTPSTGGSIDQEIVLETVESISQKILKVNFNNKLHSVFFWLKSPSLFVVFSLSPLHKWPYLLPLSK